MAAEPFTMSGVQGEGEGVGLAGHGGEGGGDFLEAGFDVGGGGGAGGVGVAGVGAGHTVAEVALHPGEGGVAQPVGGDALGGDPGESVAEAFPEVQAGWGDDGCFSEDSIVLRLDGLFTLDNPAMRQLRQAHSSRWAEDGFADDEQVGVKAISIARISDDPTTEREGRAHRLFITAHRYRYYDMLTTHVLRLRGTPAEKATLDAIVGTPTPDHPVAGFPTPCSVGLSVFCEDGATLLLVRRSRRVGTGGYWEPGSVFNAVGENATLTDSPRRTGMPTSRAPA